MSVELDACTRPHKCDSHYVTGSAKPGMWAQTTPYHSKGQISVLKQPLKPELYIFNTSETFIAIACLGKKL